MLNSFLIILFYLLAKKYWRAHASVLKEGLRDCGRFQKYMITQCVSGVQKVVPPQLLQQFLGAKDLEEQNLLYKQLPLRELQDVLRYYLTVAFSRSAVTYLTVSFPSSA